MKPLAFLLDATTHLGVEADANNFCGVTFIRMEALSSGRIPNFGGFVKTASHNLVTAAKVSTYTTRLNDLAEKNTRNSDSPKRIVKGNSVNDIFVPLESRDLLA
jgi:hypothetical protein